MQADLASRAGYSVSDNIYTLTYPELISKTMLDHTVSGEYLLQNGVSVDPLKYHPFTIDEPVKEISAGIVNKSDLTHEAAIYSGEELFAEDGVAEVPAQIAAEKFVDEQFFNLAVADEAQCRKVGNFKDNLEKLLDDVLEA